MKHSNFLFLFIIFEFSHYEFPQENTLGGFREIYLWTINADGNNTFSITGVNGIWDFSGSLSDIYIYNNNQYSIRYNEYTIEGNSGICWICGWDNLLAAGSYHNPPYFGYGIYKMKFASSSKSIYINYSDWDYMHKHNGADIYTNNDIYIKYDELNDKIYFNCAGSVPIELGNNAYLKVWEILPKNYNVGIQNTSGFSDYWQNCLALIPSQIGNHPRLIWGPHPTFSATSYRVYRAVSNNPFNPASLNYTLVQSVNSSTFEFTDNAVTILPGYQYAYYYVVGWNGTSESAKTNYVGTPAEFQKIQAPETFSEIPKDFALYQNYPNPFNPSTTIKFALPVKTNLSLNVYNTLDEKVTEIFKGEMEEGYHEMMFNASGLSSGV